MLTLDDFENFAVQKLPAPTREFYRNGAMHEETLRENRNAYSRLILRPRFMRDVSARDMTTTFLDTPVPFPIGVAPTAHQKMAHPDGEVATAKGEIHVLRLLWICPDVYTPV